MSVKVRELTKIYGTQRAVDNVSFEVQKGRILGFLGPNGAGKSTTMKMITGFVRPTAGRVFVAGIDVSEKPLLAKQKIGYLPEHNPLYLDMYVKEYLSFVAHIHRIKDVNRRVAEKIEQTGLTREQHKKIGMLSKGYRQRVGLAQALLHDPEVLILDEPTAGLDPNQLVDIRRLITEVGRQKTVILSTHIMQEVQAMCDRVIIINRGRLVADEPIEQLTAKAQGEAIIRVEFKTQVPVQKLEKLDGVKAVEAEAGHHYRIRTDGRDIREDLFRMAVQNHWVILSLAREQFSVEEVFHQLTQNANG